METLDSKRRTARKDHKCSFCGGVIQKGEAYRWSKHTQEGELYEWKSHEHCMFLASKLDMYDYCGDGVDSGTFCDVIRDEFDDQFTTADMAKLLYAKLKEKP